MSPSDVFTPFSRRFGDEGQRSLDELRGFYDDVTRRYKASIWGKPNVRAATTETALKAICSSTGLPRSSPLITPLTRCIQALLEAEAQIFDPIEADFSKPIELEARIDLNQRLRDRVLFLDTDDRCLDFIFLAFRETAQVLVNNLPQPPRSGLTVPLFTVARDLPEVVRALIAAYFAQEHEDAHLFSALNDLLWRNLCKVSGIPPQGEPTKPLVNPTEADMRPERLVDAYLGDTPLRELLLAPYPFELPAEQRFAGHWVIAPPGRGKTTLLHAMLKEDLARDAAVVLIDSKGDLIEPVKGLQAVKDRLLLIEPTPDAALALNPLDVSHASIVQAVNLIEYIMAGLLDAKFTALQSTLFRNVVPAIIEAIPNATIDDFKQTMVKGLPAASLANPYTRRFFEDRETGFYSKTYESTRKEVVWRLDYLMSNPILRSMFSATHTRLDMGKEMDDGRVIVINNSKAALGDEGAEFFGRFFVALIARAAQQRATKRPQDKKPCFVYIDECQSVIAKDTRIPVLLDECRSQKIALILAHQRTAQLNPAVLDAVANCAIRMVNSDDEAKFLAPKMRCDPEFLYSLPRGTFAAFVRDLTPAAVALEVQHSDLASLPRMSRAEDAAIRARMREQYGPSTPPVQPAAAPASDAGASPLPQSSLRSDPEPPKAPKKDTPDDTPEAGPTW